jgi:subfamily B ATP-binding cassette protein HlyB/CyaB
MPHTVKDEAMDTGITSLVIIARLHGVPIDPGQIRHQYAKSGEPLASLDLLRAAKGVGLKAREIESDWDRLKKIQLPAIAQHKDGHYYVLAKISEDKVLIQDTLERRPLTLPRALFEQSWSGKLILLTQRATLLNSFKKFDFSWFIPSIIKYRRLLGEVFVASFFIQLFALITPLFFQVVIDKVLVHRGLTTLDVLAFGLLVVSFFEVVLSGLRTYVFSHTTNRVDVELGSRLFRHLLALPISYFEARRVGDTVARVRELETI